MEDSNFLCSKYDGRDNRASSEAERDHSYYIRNVTVDGKYLGEVDTFGVHGIQGRLIAEYSKQRKCKGGMLPNCNM